jgi:hypothetical protein
MKSAVFFVTSSLLVALVISPKAEAQGMRRVHLRLANTSSGKLTIEISTAQRKELGNTLDIPLRSR